MQYILYRLWNWMHKLRVFVTRPKVSYHFYSNPKAVGDWMGWYDCDNKVIAFKGIDGKTLTKWYEGDGVTPEEEPDSKVMTRW